jgi:hypothetical protein
VKEINEERVGCFFEREREWRYGIFIEMSKQTLEWTLVVAFLMKSSLDSLLKRLAALG